MIELWEMRTSEMKRTIQVRIFRGERQYVAECLDLPVVTEAPTLDELAANIREAISLHLEGEDLAELGLAPDPTILATMELQSVGASSLPEWPARNIGEFRREEIYDDSGDVNGLAAIRSSTLAHPARR